MPEPKKETLIVPYPDPGFNITSSHNVIRTNSLATCVAIGGIVEDPHSPHLFITHKPDYDHSGQIEILKMMGLSKASGEMFIFARSPRTMRTGLYKVSPDGGKPMDYGDSINKLTKDLKSDFPGFSVRTLFYADSKYPPHWSFAEINLEDRTAITDSGLIKFQ